MHQLRQHSVRLQRDYQAGQSSFTSRTVRVQSKETNAVRAGLQSYHPQERAQGPQLRARAPQPNTVATTEIERHEAGARRAAAADQRAQARDTPAEGLHARTPGVESGDARNR